MTSAVKPELTDPALTEPVKRPFAEAARSILGRLSRWWLKPNALELIGEPSVTADSLPTHDPGGCWIVFANESKRTHGGARDATEGLLRPAFVLPLQWEQGRNGHAQNLPTQLVRMADDILETIESQFSRRLKGQFGLTLSIDPDGHHLDLSGMEDLSVDSGWVPVATGLICAIRGLTARKQIWSTGCYQNGIKSVSSDTLDAKLTLALEMGAGRVFVPESQCGDGKWTCPKLRKPLRLSPLEMDRGVTVESALRGLLQTCEYREATYLGFSHPLTAEQLEKLESEAKAAIVEEHGNGTPTITDDRPFVDQVRELVRQVPLTPREWESRWIFVNPPEFAPANSVMMAELHGRMGHFPTLVRRTRKQEGTTLQFPFAEVINLDDVREAARKSRHE